MSGICAANRTPALLAPGLPPEREMQRVREFKKRGIELIFTGDVYDEGSDKFRSEFNDTTVAILDARKGKGYVDKLGPVSRQIYHAVHPHKRCLNNWHSLLEKTTSKPSYRTRCPLVGAERSMLAPGACRAANLRGR